MFPTNFLAMTQQRPHAPLEAQSRPMLRAASHQVLLRVEACGVCRTDIHLADGELPQARYPVVPGHEIVGRVAALGDGVTTFAPGQRVGVPWLGWTCGRCEFCRHDRENLCTEARFTGCQIDGGYAEFCLADERYCFPLDETADAALLAPLLCAGLIGYRALSMAGDARHIGLYGFGAAAHIVCQVARWQGREVYAFTKEDDHASQAFALGLGATWAGGSMQAPPRPLDAALIFAAVGSLVPAALATLRKGGRVVCAGIHMSDIPAFPYELLWGERSLCSVANLTRQDGLDFLALAPQVPVRTEVTRFPLVRAVEAQTRLRRSELQGAAVLIP
ncbi:zinc-dependent alcohol dehydrogenase family protein [Denitratisoma oestradiolicum]|uniref:Putative alcohol dehydrogenase AdhA n=1 Tax=Denitratisoma oestradiolicum TaxID=311182 RepID=A0A6S6Y9P0_9PROT|nr:zinc-dependent alcohol dehydrogenase family protein [Denitratisoma oestradiolicum]TWO80308.1 alcohol dehydrogenase [Denitratisoma oestradiolicum]CAB1369302.1 putative alcohol dehydrogenase AdhA [Denitratisoma oestradiolicum]